MLNGEAVGVILRSVRPARWSSSRYSRSIAHDAGLDDGLDQKVDDAVGDGDGQHQSWTALKQRDDGRRDYSDDEADVGDEVGDEGEDSPHERPRHAQIQIECKLIVSTSARKAGPTLSAMALAPASAIVSAAAPTSTVRANGRAACRRRGPR